MNEFSKTPEWKAEMERQSRRAMEKMLLEAELDDEEVRVSRTMKRNQETYRETTGLWEGSGHRLS